MSSVRQNRATWIIASFTIISGAIIAALFIYQTPINRKPHTIASDSGGTASSTTVQSVSSPSSTVSRPVFLPDEEAQRIIANRAVAIVQAMEQKDHVKLSGLVHPVLGIRFCTWPDFRRMCSERLSSSDMETLEWFRIGSNPATGGDVIFAPAIEGYGRFLARDEILYNPASPEGPGDGPHILENMHEAFPDSIFVEYRFSGTKENSRLDWRKVFHVFQKHEDGQWYLVAVAEYFGIP